MPRLNAETFLTAMFGEFMSRKKASVPLLPSPRSPPTDYRSRHSFATVRWHASGKHEHISSSNIKVLRELSLVLSLALSLSLSLGANSHACRTAHPSAAAPDPLAQKLLASHNVFISPRRPESSLHLAPQNGSPRTPLILESDSRRYSL